MLPRRRETRRVSSPVLRLLNLVVSTGSRPGSWDPRSSTRKTQCSDTLGTRVHVSEPRPTRVNCTGGDTVSPTVTDGRCRTGTVGRPIIEDHSRPGATVTPAVKDDTWSAGRPSRASHHKGGLLFGSYSCRPLFPPSTSGPFRRTCVGRLTRGSDSSSLPEKEEVPSGPGSRRDSGRPE